MQHPHDDPGDQPEIVFGSFSDGELWLEPFVGDLKTGDVLLTRPIDRVDHLSMAFQSPHIFHAKHRRWNHAALYCGGGLVIEKQLWPFWRYDTLVNYCKSRRVLVRRYCRQLTHEEQLRLLRRAITILKEAYNPARFVGMGASSVLGLVRYYMKRLIRVAGFAPPAAKAREALAGKGMICTDLLEYCCRAAVEDHVVPQQYWSAIEYRLVPAALSWSPNFEDVEVGHRVVDVRTV